MQTPRCPNCGSTLTAVAVEKETCPWCGQDVAEPVEPSPQPEAASAATNRRQVEAPASLQSADTRVNGPSDSLCPECRKVLTAHEFVHKWCMYCRKYITPKTSADRAFDVGVRLVGIVTAILTIILLFYGCMLVGLKG